MKLRDTIDLTSELADTLQYYKNRYRPNGEPAWETWCNDQRHRLVIQEPVKKLRRFSGLEMNAILWHLGEPAYQEISTCSFIADYFLNRGAQLNDMAGQKPYETQLVVGQSQGIALRCDLDAISMGKGAYSHLCGHSVNMALLVEVWEELKSAGRENEIAIIFQPAEEGPGSEEDGYRHPRGWGGGRFLRELGVFKNFDAVLSCHIDTSLESGTVRITRGLATAAAFRFHFYAEGKPCHAALPWEGRNPVDSVADFLQWVRGYNERFQNSPDQGYGLISVTRLSTADTELNTLSREAQASGISRIRGDLPELEFLEYCREAGAVVEIEAPPVRNDDELVSAALEAAVQLGYQVNHQAAGFRDETAWAGEIGRYGELVGRSNLGSKKLLHFFIPGGKEPGSLHANSFNPDVDEVIRGGKDLIVAILKALRTREQ